MPAEDATQENAVDDLAAALDNAAIDPGHEDERTVYEDEPSPVVPPSENYYVVIRGLRTGIFADWLTAGRFVTGHKGNLHKKYKGSRWTTAYERWKEECLEDRVEGRLSHRSIVAKVVRRPEPVAEATAAE